MKTLFQRSALVLLSYSFTLAANAQQAPSSIGPAIGEIVISADFFNTPLMQSANSVSAISADSIQMRGAQHLEEAFSAVPNLSWSSAGSRSRFVQLRGLGDLEQFQDHKYYPSVGINIDNIELGSNAAAASLFGIEQVEVLRGPQGTRFGSSGHAGLINLISERPSKEFSASLSSGIGNFGQKNLGFISSGALNKSLLGRLSLQHNEGDGYVQNRFLNSDESNAYQENNLRGMLEWQANDDLSFTFNLIHFKAENGYDSWSLDNLRDTQTDQPGKDDTELYAAAISSRWSINDNYELALSYSLNSSNNDYAYDADWVNNNFCNTDPACTTFDFDQASESFIRDSKQHVIDIRLGSLDEKVVAGIYAKKTDEKLAYQYESLFFGNFASNSDYSAERFAVYGQYQFTLSDNLSLRSGLRFERYSDDYSDTNFLVSNSSQNLLGGELSLEYLINDTLLYASLTQSEKPGGVNTSASANAVWMSTPFQVFTANKLRFDTETLLNKELGLKQYFFNEALSIRAALFHTARNQAQLESWMWDATAGLWIGYLDSTSDANNYGAELEGNFQASRDLEFFFSIGLLETEVDRLGVFDLDLNTFVSRNNREQAKAPNWQYALGGEYAFNSRLKLKIEFEGRDESYYGYYHDGKLDGYNLMHASLNYQLGNVDLTFWARNLSNKDYAVHGLYFAADARNGWQNEIYRQFGAPRTFGLNASYTF
jgi:iron complex outermembrane receptor protein